MSVRVRIAPSPTGDPHIGTAYIGLINRVFADKHDGRFILRVDDTDQTRCTPQSEAMIFEALQWVGIRWDEGPDCGGDHGPYRQSERTEIYRSHAAQLVEHGKAYPCFCSPERLAALREEQKAAKGWLGYDGHCRDIEPADAQARVDGGESHVIRLKVDKDAETVVEDLLREPIRFANKEVDDQVLMKSDGYPTYHLATVVDDHLMEISHVIRGEEWITSAPKHIMLFEAFGWEAPVLCHVPLLRNADKSKVTKRKNPVSLNYYRDSGILPEALCNYLARMAWSYPVAEGEETREKFSYDEMVEAFTLERISLGGPVFDLAKLSWLNGRYIREDHSAEEIWLRLREHLLSDQRWAQIVPLIHERMDRLDEFMPQVAYFFSGDLEMSAEALKPKKKSLEELEPVLAGLIEKMDALMDWSEEPLEALLRGHCEESGWKPRDLFMPIRVAVTGRKATPGMWETLAVLGKERTRRRLREALKRVKAANRP